MALYLDCEFNGHGGQLISMAIVSQSGDKFYGVLPLPDDVHPWVQQHVVPVLQEEAEPHHVFRYRLGIFLQRLQHEIIYADWPEDFSHLMQSICEPGGLSLNVELNMRLIRSGTLNPDIPHNALSDAKALMAWHSLLRHGHV